MPLRPSKPGQPVPLFTPNPNNEPADPRIGGSDTILILPAQEEEDEMPELTHEDDPQSREVLEKWVREAVKDAMAVNGVERTDNLLARSASVMGLIVAFVSLVGLIGGTFLHSAIRLDRIETSEATSSEDRKALHSEMTGIRDAQISSATDIQQKLSDIKVQMAQMNAKLPERK